MPMVSSAVTQLQTAPRKTSSASYKARAKLGFDRQSREPGEHPDQSYLIDFAQRGARCGNIYYCTVARTHKLMPGTTA